MAHGLLAKKVVPLTICSPPPRRFSGLPVPIIMGPEPSRKVNVPVSVYVPDTPPRPAAMIMSLSRLPILPAGSTRCAISDQPLFFGLCVHDFLSMCCDCGCGEPSGTLLRPLPLTGRRAFDHGIRTTEPVVLGLQGRRVP